MKEFDVTITETLQRTVTVRADDRAEAEEMVQESWNSEEYVLDSGDFVEADFKANEGREITPPTISVLLVQPEKFPQRIVVVNTLENLQKLVGDTVQATYPYADPVALLMDDEGHLNGSPMNRALRGDDGVAYDVVCGDFLVVGLGVEDFQSLSPDLMEKYETMFHQPEMFLNMGRNIIVMQMPDKMLQEPQQAAQAHEDIAPEL